MIVPADAWYEWVPVTDGNQPYCIHRSDGGPLYFGGLASVEPCAVLRKGDDFVIVTTMADGHLVDLHHRWPLVFDADDARAWLEAESADAAREVAQSSNLAPATVELYPVSSAVGNEGRNGPGLIECMASN